MPDWLSNSGALVVYGAILALVGGIVGGWLQRRWTCADDLKRRKQQTLIEMIDIAARIRAGWGVVVTVSATDLEDDTLFSNLVGPGIEVIRDLGADIAKLKGRAEFVGDINGTLTITQETYDLFIEKFTSLPADEDYAFVEMCQTAIDTYVGALRTLD